MVSLQQGTLALHRFSSFCGFFILLFSQQSFPLFSQIIGNRPLRRAFNFVKAAQEK